MQFKGDFDKIYDITTKVNITAKIVYMVKFPAKNIFKAI
jgi:hypothetical protein